jgi:hypothetical protein
MSQPFTIFVTQSAHTDIGYTHPQDQIKHMYLDYYEHLLELCRNSEQDPEEYRFKWVCETAWQVRNFVENRPELEEEFLHFVRNGQIEITAAYLHFTDLIDADGYARALEWAVNYCQKHHLPLNCAMHADINGWTWGLADALAEKGIRYFISHIHIDSATDPLGERGSVHYQWLLPQAFGNFLRSDTKFRVPQAFWWQGPAGGKVFHWLNEHYHLGNFLGLSATEGFPSVKKSSHYYDVDHQTADDMYEIASRELPEYITRLRQAGYPYNILMVNTSGYFTDNGAPDQRWTEVIRRWNTEHSDLRLRTATFSEWFEALEKEIAERTLPTHAVAWPDHWAHGLGSETAVVSLARQTQRRRTLALGLVKESGSAKAASFLEQALEEERFALEHTFDAWCTTYRPASPLNPFEQIAKELTFYRADQFLDEAVATALRAIAPTRPEKPSLYVYTDENAPTLRLVHFDAIDYRVIPELQLLEAVDGTRYPFQLDDPSIPRYVAALMLKPGLNRFSLIESDVQLPDDVLQSESTLQTKGWRLTVDAQRGSLSSLVERSSEKEWVDSGQEYGFGQLIHEAVIHPLGREACGNRARLVALGVAKDEVKEHLGNEAIFKHTPLTIEKILERQTGPVFDVIHLSGQAEITGPVKISWRAYHALPVVELNLEWDKHWCDLPEAAYVVFPFQAPMARLSLESGGGFFVPGSHTAGGQLPGTCSSYYTIQRAAHIQPTEGEGLFWLPLDAPLVMTNAVRYNRWETKPYEWNGLLASMPVNHYWHTNFPSSQRGPLKLRYRLVARQGFPDDNAALQAAMPVEVFGWR